MSITLQKGRVYVFGASDDAAYIEGFCDQDGCNLFRFSTAY